MIRLPLASLFAASALLAGPAQAQPADSTNLAHDNLAWTEIVPGIEFAPSYGDWNTEAHGKFVRFAPGAAVPDHTHTGAYRGVMISGRLNNPYPGEGEPPVFGPGDSWFVPGAAVHANTCVSDEPCLFYTHADGPWDVAITEAE